MKNQKRLPAALFGITLGLITVFSTASWARLAPVSWKEFLKNSTLVIDATPLSVQTSAPGPGGAKFRINRVLRGSLPDGTKEIEVSWGNEAHEQRVTDTAVDWILFLKKKTDGKGYEGGTYGRSYWPLTSKAADTDAKTLENPSRHLLYDYPAAMVTLNKAQQAALLTKGSGQKDRYGKEIPMIPLSNLEKALK